jgi:phospholipase C
MPAITPSTAPFDHVIVVMMENRSFDHFLGWLPGADGHQADQTYTDTNGATHTTFNLAPDYQGCGYADPDHSWEGGVKQLAGGTMSGFLQTARPGDTFPIGYYTEASVPVIGALARNYTVSDRYFCAILAETFPNRFYMHSAMTPRDHNSDPQPITQPTIWDRLADAGLTGTYYYTDAPFLALWGGKHTNIIKPLSKFLSDCAAGTLPNVAFVDPAFVGEDSGTSADDHPHADIRSGEAFLAHVYNAVRQSPAWSKTVMVITHDEWGGFFDHVPPPKVADAYVNPNPGPHPDYRQLGFRVPNVVVSPFAAAGKVVSGGAPFEHTSVLRMIEWRWGLAALTARDANARNLVDMLDFSLARTDLPVIPTPAAPSTMACPVATTLSSPTTASPVVTRAATPALASSGSNSALLAATGAALLAAGIGVASAGADRRTRRPDDAGSAASTR